MPAPDHPPRRVDYPTAVGVLRREFEWNSWFLHSYWPENEPRIRMVYEYSRPVLAGPAPPRVFEVGCANGFVAYLYSQFGCKLSAADAYEDAKRDDMFRRSGVEYRPVNLNDARPLEQYPDAAFDLVLLGEVFEHILNQPAGLLRAIHRILVPGGRLILTTPNPSTLMNAVRVLRDRYVLWGTNEFLRHTKVDGERIIDEGGIHYREYLAGLVRDLLREIGFRVPAVRYVRTGAAPRQSVVKRFAKGLLRLTRLDRLRLLSPGYIIVADK
jgi:SAM-dependent methyltransferase